MKNKFRDSLIVGGIFFFLGLVGIFKAFGVTVECGFICFDLDHTLMLMSFWGMLCSFIAYKKNRSTGSALFVGMIFGPLAVLYYLLAKSGMSDKEKELHEWELDKKYQKMQEEKTQQP